MAFQINPPNTPLVDARGIVTPAWYRYFASIQSLIGGAALPWEDYVTVVGAPSLATAAMNAPDTTLADLPPPRAVNDVPDVLIPPPMPMQSPRADDLMYPPHFGANT